MNLPVYTKKINSNEFMPKGTWEFSKGWYNDGKHQYMTKFEYVGQISTCNKHYYRFPLYGSIQTNSYYWLKLNCIQFFIFRCIQDGVWKTLVSPLATAIKFFISIFK